MKPMTRKKARELTKKMRQVYADSDMHEEVAALDLAIAALGGGERKVPGPDDDWCAACGYAVPDLATTPPAAAVESEMKFTCHFSAWWERHGKYHFQGEVADDVVKSYAGAAWDYSLAKYLNAHTPPTPSAGCRGET